MSGSGDTALMMSSLDDVDKHTNGNNSNSSQRTDDLSSEDSGTACHLHSDANTNGNRCHGLNSPANSVGNGSSSSEANNDTFGCHLLDAVGGRHRDEEMEAVVIDPSTGTVIGKVYSSAQSKSQSQSCDRGSLIVREEDDEGGGRGSATPVSDVSDHENCSPSSACGEHTSNDRDSGHGSEVKSQSMSTSFNYPEEHLEAPAMQGELDTGFAPYKIPPLASISTSPTLAQQQDTSLPPPPPSPPLHHPTPDTLATATTPLLSPQQLSTTFTSTTPPPTPPSCSPSLSTIHGSNKHANRLPQAADRTGHRYPRTSRLQSPISDLPAPPPPPPLDALTNARFVGQPPLPPHPHNHMNSGQDAASVSDISEHQLAKMNNNPPDSDSIKGEMEAVTFLPSNSISSPLPPHLA